MEVKLYDFPGDGGDSLAGTQPHIVTDHQVQFTLSVLGGWGQVLTVFPKLLAKHLLGVRCDSHLALW